MAHGKLTGRLPVIGVVRTSHQELGTTPIQAVRRREPAADSDQKESPG